MSEPKTKREARRAVRAQMHKATASDGTMRAAAGLGKGYESECLAAAARVKTHRAEAARLRALLPTLPE